MNPAWTRRQRRAYARKCLEATTGAVRTHNALRMAYGVAWRILACVAALAGGYYAGVLVTMASGGAW